MIFDSDKLRKSTNLFRCPACKSEMKLSKDFFKCQDSVCKASYPFKDGRPVLINEKDSLFLASDYDHIPKPQENIKSKIKEIVDDIAPTFSTNLSADKCLEKFIDLLVEQNNSSIVLVVGCGSKGKAMEKLLDHPSITVINTDVSPKAQANLFCDGHDLPFKDGCIDGVITQAVLEHVVDPYRCAEEINRVLKVGGAVYSEMPFMQQGHSGRYDFTRFTHLGHRRLFRKFDAIDSGVCGGAGTSIAWAWEYLLMSFGRTPRSIKLMSATARVTGFWLKYFDYILKNSPGSIDAASCTYFLGRKKKKGVVGDREIIEQYRGAQEF